MLLSKVLSALSQAGARPGPAHKRPIRLTQVITEGERLLTLGGNICDDPSVVWSPDSQRTIVQDGRVIANSRAPL
jgi:hypothetical protein